MDTEEQIWIDHVPVDGTASRVFSVRRSSPSRSPAPPRLPVREPRYDPTSDPQPAVARRAAQATMLDRRRRPSQATRPQSIVCHDHGAHAGPAALSGRATRSRDHLLGILTRRGHE